jgi:sulfite exporter TauE/SafE
LFLVALGILTILVLLATAIFSLFVRKNTIKDLQRENEGLRMLVDQIQTGRVAYDPFKDEHPLMEAK